MNTFAGGGTGGLTQNAGTVIQYLIQPNRKGKARVSTLKYTDTGTAHTLTFLRPLGRTTINAAGAASQAVISLAEDPGTDAGYGGISNAIAANDFIAIRTESDGQTRLYKVSSLTVITAITLTGNLTVAVADGDAVWFFGVTTDTDGRDGGLAHPKYLGGAGSAAVTHTDAENGLVCTISKDEPILFNSNNASNAGTVSQLSWGYTVN